MKMKKVRKCDGCKAYWESAGRHNCDLGYSQKIVGKKMVLGVELAVCAPRDGECPKPTTLKDYWRCNHCRD